MNDTVRYPPPNNRGHGQRHTFGNGQWIEWAYNADTGAYHVGDSSGWIYTRSDWTDDSDVAWELAEEAYLALVARVMFDIAVTWPDIRGHYTSIGDIRVALIADNNRWWVASLEDVSIAAKAYGHPVAGITGYDSHDEAVQQYLRRLGQGHRWHGLTIVQRHAWDALRLRAESDRALGRATAAAREAIAEGADSSDLHFSIDDHRESRTTVANDVSWSGRPIFGDPECKADLTVAEPDYLVTVIRDAREELFGVARGVAS